MMKKTFFFLSTLIGCMFLALSCSEDLVIDKINKEAPSIDSFEPATGPVGTIITITGDHLQDIEDAYIGDTKVTIKERVSATKLILRATSEARTGKIKLVNSEGEVETAESFTYVYPTPAISESPTSYMVGDVIVFFGTDMDAVLSVKFKDTEAEIIDKRSTELVIKVPDIRDAVVDITFSYFNGSSDVTFALNDVNIVREVPFVEALSPNTGVNVGDEITATGNYLHLVEKITLGGIEMRITNQAENGLSLKFRIADDKSFADGNNTKELIFYSFNDTEILNVDANYAFFVPKFYIWKNANLNAHSISRLNHFFCLETGETYPADDFETKVDPFTMSKGGGVCVGSNKLSPSVTEADYYGVKPYIFMGYLGSGSYLYGPANNNNRISNFKTSATGNPALLPSGKAYGTPIIKFRALSTANATENAIITKIKNGTFSSGDFSPDLLDAIDLTQDGNTTEDAWSNIPNGEFAAFKAVSKTNTRPWAPALTAATETVDMDPGTVALVMYYKPNWDTISDTKESIYKFGFIEITNLKQDRTVESGRQNNVTFNIYWQRTAME